ncbi:MAG: helix-turn-helix domain-containing protein [Planctomycetota bacterium]
MTQSIGSRIANLRKASKLNQTDLMEIIEVSQSQMSKIEGGKVPFPTDVDFRALAEALNTNLAGLLEGTDLAHKVPRDEVPRFMAGGQTWRAYYASALTGLTDEQRSLVFSDADIAREICEEAGLFLYEPRRFTDPVNHPDKTARAVYRTDRIHVHESRVVLLNTRYPSFGAGQEVEVAIQFGIPVVLLSPRGQRITRMIEGCHASLHHVEFDSEDELRDGLREQLRDALNEGAAIKRGRDLSGMRARLEMLREDRNYNPETVAGLVGVSADAIIDAETVDSSSLSLCHLSRMAEVYDRPWAFFLMVISRMTTKTW